MNANDVMRIGRRRFFAALLTLETISSPLSCLCLANSAMSMAFLQASPISTTMPICPMRLLSIPRTSMPSRAKRSTSGTMSIMLSGSDQLS